MAHLVTFQSSAFIASDETENPINPIAGESVLRWLASELSPDISFSPPDYEDWGWYCDVEAAGQSYLVGASGDATATQPMEWTVQIHKNRRIIEKITGKNKMQPDDPVSRAINSVIERDSRTNDVTFEIDA